MEQHGSGGGRSNDGQPSSLARPPGEVHPHDVMCGRGGQTNNHPGNEWFRRLVRSNRDLYNRCPKHTKLLVAKAIVQAVQDQVPGGRFMKIKAGTTLWEAIPYNEAVGKTSQALRERALSSKTRAENARGKRKGVTKNTKERSNQEREKAFEIAKKVADRIKTNGLQPALNLAELTSVAIKSATEDLEHHPPKRKSQKTHRHLQSLEQKNKVAENKQRHRCGIDNQLFIDPYNITSQNHTDDVSSPMQALRNTGSLGVNSESTNVLLMSSSSSPATTLASMVTPGFSTSHANANDSNKRMRLSAQTEGGSVGMLSGGTDSGGHRRIQHMGRRLVNRVTFSASDSQVMQNNSIQHPAKMTMAQWQSMRSTGTMHSSAAETVDPLAASVYDTVRAGATYCGMCIEPRHFPKAGSLRNPFRSNIFSEQQRQQQRQQQKVSDSGRFSGMDGHEEHQLWQHDASSSASQGTWRPSYQQMQLRQPEVGQNKQQQPQQMAVPFFPYKPETHACSGILEIQDQQQGEDTLEEIPTVGLANVCADDEMVYDDRAIIPSPPKDLKAHVSDVFTSFFSGDSAPSNNDRNTTTYSSHAENGGDFAAPPLKGLSAQISDLFTSFFGKDQRSANNMNGKRTATSGNRAANGDDCVMPPSPPKGLTAQMSDLFASFFKEDGSTRGRKNSSGRNKNQNFNWISQSAADIDDSPLPLPPGGTFEGGLMRSISSSLFSLVEHPSMVLNYMKSSVSSPAQTAFTYQKPQQQQQQKHRQPGFGDVSIGDGMAGNSLLGQRAEQRSSLLDDFEETPMEQQLRNAQAKRNPEKWSGF